MNLRRPFECKARRSLARCASSASSGREQTFSSTVLLPRTPFPLRADASRREKLWSRRIGVELYRWQWEQKERPLWILHDGPPYANGNLHAGHALNKVIKDIINRYKVLRGFRVHYLPGWDCHGLPIELKVLEGMKKAKKNLSTLTPTQIRTAARELASKNVVVQLSEFKELGIMVDWEQRYHTYDPSFEIRQLRVLQAMINRGLILRARKPVYYSPSSTTALAESELEYNENHKSRSVYLAFPLTSPSPELLKHLKGLSGTVSLAIWTTTPWTIPANMAVAVSSDLEYSIVKHSSHEYLIVGSKRLDDLRNLFSDDLVVVSSFPGSTLVGSRYRPPLSTSDRSGRVIISPYVSDDTGTGLVHSAPGHGFEDWLICHEIMEEEFLTDELLTTVDDAGRFQNSIRRLLQPEVAENLISKPVLQEGTTAILEFLHQQKYLIAEVPIAHKYPYDWRTKKPVIIRVTPQWFANLDGIKERALFEIDRVKFTPNSGRTRLEAFVRNRGEWCISRQRAWGVPIPALLDPHSGESLLTPDSMTHIISVLEREGIDYWWTGPVEDFVLPQHRHKTWIKSQDTMDVWFDSGSSWTTIKEAGLTSSSSNSLVDLYLEGSDQHRGWFQSSLLTSVCTQGKSPYAQILTHGFVLDASGQKMSKSLGNVTSHLTVINGGENKKTSPAYGRDVFRLWAANVDYTGDVLIGPAIIQQVFENLKKLRNTLRFLLGYVKCSNPIMLPEHLNLLDRYVLHEVWKLDTMSIQNYDDFAINKVTQHVNRFVNSVLSGLYLDSVKDELYSNKVDDMRRQNIIAVLSEILQCLLRVLSPITPHLCEEVSYFLAGNHKDPEAEFNTTHKSAFQQGWSDPPNSWNDPSVERDMTRLLEVRQHVFGLIEKARQEKVIVNSTEVEVYLRIAPEAISYYGTVLTHGEVLEQLFLTSTVFLQSPPDGLLETQWQREAHIDGLDIWIRPARHSRCHRCWRHNCDSEDILCSRCADVIRHF